MTKLLIIEYVLHRSKPYTAVVTIFAAQIVLIEWMESTQVITQQQGVQATFPQPKDMPIDDVCFLHGNTEIQLFRM